MSYNQLTSEQRYTISLMLQNGEPVKSIAQLIGVHRSTVYRELNRNVSPYSGKYKYKRAQKMADDRKHRFQKPRKLTPGVRNRIIILLHKDWSPCQISGRMKMLGRPMVSHETIYEMIRRDRAKGGKLYQHCRFQLKHCNHWIRRRGQKLPDDRKSIDSRPAQADGTRFGDWEMDLIVGADNSSALTMVERSTNMLIIRKLPRKRKAQDVTKAVISALKPIKDCVLTITTDNGPEFSDYRTIEKKLESQVYYAHPYCPWQKGDIENHNMLIRQYIPKGFNINTISTQYIASVESRINARPRKKLNFRTPDFVFKKRMSKFALGT